MVETRRIVRVFLASPGDLADERRCARAVTDEINDLYLADLGYRVELVGWEDTVSVFGRPQATINRELERCEIFIGMLWRRWGTPPDNEGKYSSGFEEEFQASLRRREQTGTPEMSLFFKEVDNQFLVDPGHDLTKVQDFKQALIAEKRILFQPFADTRDFESKFRRCVVTRVQELRSREAVTPQEQSRLPALRVEENSADTQRKTLEGATYLHEFLRSAQRSDKGELDVAEVARLRLIATLLGVQGNDDSVLGVHDANVLYLADFSSPYSDREVAALLSSGLFYHAYENAPIWRWYTERAAHDPFILSYFTVSRRSSERAGALNAMRLLSQSLIEDESFDRTFFFGKWFGKDSPQEVRNAAWAYLAEAGTPADVPLIRGLEENLLSTQAAVDAVLCIYLRESKEKALQALYEMQPSSVSDAVLLSIFSQPDSLDAETLLSGLEHRSASVRHIVVRLLIERDALPQTRAEQLMEDSDVQIRYEVLRFAISKGRLFSEEQAKRILVRPSRPGLLGIGSSDREGQLLFSKVRLELYRGMPEAELNALIEGSSPLDATAELAMFERHFHKLKDTLQRHVKERFASYFESKIDALERKVPGEEEVIAGMRDLSEFVRGKFVQQAMEILCSKGDETVLKTVRHALREQAVPCSNSYIEYFSKYGEWADVQLIVDLVSKPSDSSVGALLIGDDDTQRYRTAARAILSLGKNRVREVLTIDATPRLKQQLIAAASTRAFAMLGDEAILKMLRSEHDNLRRAVAFKIILSFNKARVRTLLEKYTEPQQHRYYNVVYWLDSVFLPVQIAKTVARKMLHTMT